MGDLKEKRDLGVDVRDCMFDEKSSLAFLSSPHSLFFPLDATKIHLLLIPLLFCPLISFHVYL